MHLPRVTTKVQRESLSGASRVILTSDYYGGNNIEVDSLSLTTDPLGLTRRATVVHLKLYTSVMIIMEVLICQKPRGRL